MSATEGNHPPPAQDPGTQAAKHPLVIYGYEMVTDLLQGWQTHVARQRLIHEQSARRIQRSHYLLGVLAVVFASLAGSSAVAAWEKQNSNTFLAIVSALIATAAAVLAGVVTFLDLGGRAERHRKAAAEYKQALRKLEAIGPREPIRLDALDGPLADCVEHMRTALGDLDASAPIPPRRIAEDIEKRPVKLCHSVSFEGKDESPGSPPAG